MTPRFKEYLYSRWYLRDLLFPMAKRSEEMIRNPSEGQRTRNNAQQRWLLVFYIYYYYCLSSPNILFPCRSLQDNPELSINSNLLAAHSSSLSAYQPSFLSLFSVGYLSTKMQIRSEYYVTVNHCLVRFRQPHFWPVLSCLSASLDLYVMDKSNLAAKILQLFYTVFLFSCTRLANGKTFLYIQNEIRDSKMHWVFRRLAYIVNNI